MYKIRVHNEYFRRVNTKSIHVDALTLPLADYLCGHCQHVTTQSLERVKEGHGQCTNCNHFINPQTVPMCPPFQRTYKKFSHFESSRKSCPTCKAKIEAGEFVWSWGEYHNAKWHTVQHFCKSCFPDIKESLIKHKDDCGCLIELIGYRGEPLPDWLTIGPCTTIFK